MIEQIDIDSNVGNSIKTINDNVAELDALICNLQTKRLQWQDAMSVWDTHYADWDSTATTINELSAKWMDMTSVVRGLSSFWNGQITFIYPDPFVEGTENQQPIHDFLLLNHAPEDYSTGQKVSVFFFIQNYPAITTHTNNIFQKSVSSVCFQNTGSDWSQIECNRNEYCIVDDCSALFEVIDVNDQYSCMAKTEILYYLISTT
jgi:hypothetical protein